MKTTQKYHFRTPNWRAVFSVFTRTLERQDPYTKGHSDRVAHSATLLAAELGQRYPEIWTEYYKECDEIAGRFHDIGKIMVEKSTLQNTDPLTPEQREQLDKHPVDGAWMLAEVLPEEVCLGIHHHHQRWDGQGYPKIPGSDRGLQGLEIPPIARAIAICDTFDAMTTERSYNVGRIMTTSAAAKRIAELAGTQFDPDYAKIFVEKVIPLL